LPFVRIHWCVYEWLDLLRLPDRFRWQEINPKQSRSIGILLEVLPHISGRRYLASQISSCFLVRWSNLQHHSHHS
jgi:hypothetical protein